MHGKYVGLFDYNDLWLKLFVDNVGITYTHKLTPFPDGGRKKLQNATCYDLYILLLPRPHSYI